MNDIKKARSKVLRLWQRVEQLFGRPWLVLILVVLIAVASWWLWRGPMRQLRRELRLDVNLVSQEDQSKPAGIAEPILPNTYLVQSISRDVIALEGDGGIFFVSEPARNLELKRGQPGNSNPPNLETSELAVGQRVRVELLDGTRVRLWLE